LKIEGRSSRIAKKSNLIKIIPDTVGRCLGAAVAKGLEKPHRYKRGERFNKPSLDGEGAEERGG